MDQVFKHLLEHDEGPFTHDAQLEVIKQILTASNLCASPLINLNFARCSDKLSITELSENLTKFKGVLQIEEKAEYCLTIAFSNMLNTINFVKFFTHANEVDINPYTFDISFEESIERNNVLCEQKDKENGSKKQKKKSANSSAKYTARFYFYIESSYDFELSKKIIGKKGKNMKMILNECEQIFEPNKVPRDFLKLRLRGRGSSYKEGATNKESDEDLHLCLSAKNPDVLGRAVESIEKLLEVISKEYSAHCKKHGLKQIKRLYRLVSDLNK